MTDEEYLNLLTFGKSPKTISITPHPDDVIDVDPSIIANMKERLKGTDRSSLYDNTDRVIDELALRREKIKLGRVFGSPDEIREAYSSIKNIRTAKEELSFEGVNRKLLSDYAFIKSGEKNVDEVDFYQFFLFGSTLSTKEIRLKEVDALLGGGNSLRPILDHYKANHFNILKVTKEIIYMNEEIKKYFRKRKLGTMFNQLLRAFYGSRYE